jgi:hypothetical protein
MKLGLSIGYSRAHLEVPVALVQRAEELATTRSSRRKPTAPMRYGDGWMPHRTRTQYADVQALLPKFREMAVDEGRDPASVPIWGAGEDLDLLKRDREDGASRLVVSLDSGKADTILPQLDRWATLIRQLGS